MARHRAERPDSDDAVEETADRTESTEADEADDLDSTADTDADDADDEDEEEKPRRSEEADKWWSDVRVDVVELALPSGVGYTLRAYRMSDELPGAEDTAEEKSEPAETSAAKDTRESVSATDKRGKHRADDKKRKDIEEAEEDLDEDEREDLDDEDLEDEDLEDEDFAAEDEEETEPEPEEIPIFLAHRGRLLLFRTPEALVSFVKSDAPHDLTALDTWDRVVAEIRPEYVVALPDDTYELDLVVDNLRGGHDAWEPELVISAGEVARDLGYALRIEPILTALAPESPLDDLDEALRAAVGGGLGAFFARRRLKRIGAQQAALAWRTIIGKITTATDWRD